MRAWKKHELREYYKRYLSVAACHMCGKRDCPLQTAHLDGEPVRPHARTYLGQGVQKLRGLQRRLRRSGPYCPACHSVVQRMRLSTGDPERGNPNPERGDNGLLSPAGSSRPTKTPGLRETVNSLLRRIRLTRPEVTLQNAEHYWQELADTNIEVHGAAWWEAEASRRSSSAPPTWVSPETWVKWREELTK